MNAPTNPYDRNFYDLLEGTALPSAGRIVPYLLSLCQPRSVVDVGCGDGSWLSVYAASGIDDIQGFDGNWVALDQLRIPAANFRRVSLDVNLPCERRFDLASCLEVAEHLPVDRAAGFVAELCALAPLVAFSAAIPGQGGLNHFNERWPDYWVELFARQNYRPIDSIRPRFWSDDKVAWWYKQNMMLFASAEALEHWPDLAHEAERHFGSPPALVHPDVLAQAVRLSQPRFGRWLRMGKAALLRSMAK